MEPAGHSTFPPRHLTGSRQPTGSAGAATAPRLTTEELFAAYHEFIVKACEIIAQARTRDLMGEPVPCRKFALLVPEKFGCRSYLDASELLFKNKISYTLEVKRMVQDVEGLESKATPPRHGRKRPQRSAIMERWYFHFTPIDDEPPDDRRPESLRSKDETILRRMAVALRSLYPLTRILPAFTYFKEAGMAITPSEATTPRPEMRQRDCPRHRHLVQAEESPGGQKALSSGGSQVKLQVSLWHYKPTSGEDDVTMVTPEHDVLTAEPRDLPNSPVGEICALGSSIGTLRIILHREREIHKSAYWKKKWSATPTSVSPVVPTSREGSRVGSRPNSGDFALPPGPLSETPATKGSGIVIDDAFFGGAGLRDSGYISSSSPLSPRVQSIGGGAGGSGNDLEMVIEDQFGNKVSLPGELSDNEEVPGENVSLPSLYSLLIGSSAGEALLGDPYWRTHPAWLQEAVDKMCGRSAEMDKCLKDPLLSLRGVWAGHLASATNSPETSPVADAVPCPCCGYVDDTEAEQVDLDWPEVEESPAASVMPTEKDSWSDGYCESEYSMGEMTDAGIESGTDLAARRDSVLSHESSGAGRRASLPFGSVASMMQFVLDRNSHTVSAGLVVDAVRQAQQELRRAKIQ
ncbi:hypothetical protein FOZ60_014661 [Perkinsus olseni]|uniref:Autophagy-related protein 13 N-terminal domain-containing protein n=1 Tax=Perkinsus olseni TaxID=32597 RepID=A0A7J6PLA9_PEROL|nr:hypothetical protein FOZ60_014661 [Perkinsus olseni]